MNPIAFKNQTKVLQKPTTMTDEECGPLPVFNDGKECISCWQLSLRERLKIAFTGILWLRIVSGATQPPVWPTLEDPFEEKNDEAKQDT